MHEFYIGLMSGTSLDGIDAVLVDFKHSQPKTIATHYEKMPLDLRQSILDICQPGPNEINRMGELDVLLGKQFANAANSLLKKSNTPAAQVLAIGSHGQTIRHHPNKQFTLQIGDPNIIAAETGITTIADFRRRDVACGGQGAPLVPAFHHAIFANAQINRTIVNIGGIANITLLLKNALASVLGFDTGPGNTLLDAWMEKNFKQPCDKKGAWASQGIIDNKLLAGLLNDSFFKLSPPKSTGREYFNLDWLHSYLSSSIPAINVQTTLVELTAQSILNAIYQHMPDGEILICGGGVHNNYLMQRLQKLSNSTYSITTTETYGIDPDWVEAIAFAWLAKQTLLRKPGNLISVTGANTLAILGGVYFA